MLTLNKSLPSNLVPIGGAVTVTLMQEPAGFALVGSRDAFYQAQRVGQAPNATQIEHCRRILHSTSAGSNALTAISLLRGISECEAELRTLGNSRTIVAHAGVDSGSKNSTYIATGGQLLCKDKISLSSEDVKLGVVPGNELQVFLPQDDRSDSAVRWAVLNCHDYSHADVIRTLLDQQLELLVVVTYNAATRLYWEYAISDIHRLFCYIVVVNVAELGGSAVFAPFRRIGREDHAQIGAGGSLFAARGSASLKVDVRLDMQKLRELREGFSQFGFNAGSEASKSSVELEAVVPSQHFMNTVDREAGAPSLEEVQDIPIEWNFSNPRIAVAQLRSLPQECYLETKYRIRNSTQCAEFEELLNLRLLELEMRCRRSQGERKQPLDMLLFPEVFIPRSFLSTLQGYADRLGCVTVAGMDYPDGGEGENANECAILRPGKQPLIYRKITRSQYDAVRPNDLGRMPMQRGAKLFRFVEPHVSNPRGFGVLICYDFSHFDLYHSLNLRHRQFPLDLVAVVSHNPFGALYRSCCISDSHRFYQYVAMCNVSQYGGSGVFGPLRTPGARQTLMEMGKGTEAITVVELDLAGLRNSRGLRDEDLHQDKFMRKSGLFQSSLIDRGS